MSEHLHRVHRAVSGLSALPGTARPLACSKALYRFLDNDAVTLPALIEPVQEAVRAAAASSGSPFALVVHDWCMFQFNTHAGKADGYQRRHDQDRGYDVGTALVVDAADGRPLGPVEFRFRTADALLTTRPGGAAKPPGHVDERLGAMGDARRWGLGKTPVHVIDREADSVGHFRRWHAAGHQFLVRADAERVVRWRGREMKLRAVARGRALEFRDVRDDQGRHEVVTTRKDTGSLRVAETAVVLDRPAVTNTGQTTPAGTKQKKRVPGEALTLRLVVTRAVNEVGVVLAEWLLFTNVPAAAADAAAGGRWYAWRWRIETYHKLLKTAGRNAEEWQQECGEAFAKRLVIASMACLTVWHLQRDESAEAARLRAILQRLSGRHQKHRKPPAAPALLAGLEKLRAMVDLRETESLEDIRDLVRRCLPRLFNSS